jgi:hypothetical protein
MSPICINLAISLNGPHHPIVLDAMTWTSAWTSKSISGCIPKRIPQSAPDRGFEGSIFFLLSLGASLPVAFPKRAPQTYSCVNDALVPSLPASLLALFGIPGAHPVER